MEISQDGIDFIKEWEGLELEAYQDIAGVWTIGYGHTETAERGMVITEQKAEALLRTDLERFERAVNEAVKVDLHQHEFDALVSFTFNIGVAALKRSTALRLMNLNEREDAGDALLMWNKAKVGGVLTFVQGLSNRREAEREAMIGTHKRCIDAEGLVTATGLSKYLKV